MKVLESEARGLILKNISMVIEGRIREKQAGSRELAFAVRRGQNDARSFATRTTGREISLLFDSSIAPETSPDAWAGK